MTTKRIIEYEIKNGALYMIKSMIDKIGDIILYASTNNVFCLSEKFNEMRENIARIDLSSYYMADGRKVTKPIKKIAEKFLGQEIVKEKWPEICNKISELYSIAKAVKVYFGDKSLLGSGRYEANKTCFADDGCNKFSRIFLEKFKRTEVLIIEDILSEKKARSIVYFAGGRNIYLTNFYFQNGMINNPLLFVEALKRIMNLKQVTFKDKIDKFEGLPIYFNGHAIHIYDKKSFEYKRDRKFPCPHCDNTVKEKHFFVDRSSSAVLLGCDENCATIARNSCSICQCDLEEDEMLSVEFDDDIYCQSCYDDEFFTCHNCERDNYNNEMCVVNDYQYCQSCYNELFTTCDKCNEEILKDDAIITDKDDNQYCQSCYNELFTTCDKCNEDIFRDDAIITDKDDNQYCRSCYDELVKTVGSAMKRY